VILADLRHFLRQNKKSSIKDLSIHFHAEADALRGMLSLWIRKGKVRQVSAGGENCGAGCCQCDPLLTEVYEWIEDD
jgi:hypothetical protein